MLSTKSSASADSAMSIKVKGLLFTGPYELETTTVRRNHTAVVYIVVDKVGEAWDPKYRIMDVDETAGNSVEFKSHPELANWKAAARGKICLYFYTPDVDSGDLAAIRQNVVTMIRSELQTGLVV
jgi:hypothetical protein